MIKLKIRNAYIFTLGKLGIKHVFDTFHRIYFSVKEQKVLGFVKKRPKVKSDPSLLLYFMSFSVELRFAESWPVNPRPFPIPATAPKTVEWASGLVRFWIEGTHFIFTLFRLFVNNDLIYLDFSVSIAPITFVRDNAISYCCHTLIISANVGIICKHLCIFLEDRNVESRYSLRLSISTDSVGLSDSELKVLLFNIEIKGSLVKIFWQIETNFFLNFDWTDIFGPVINLHETAIAKINEVDLTLVNIVLRKHEPIDFLSTILNVCPYLRISTNPSGFYRLHFGTGAKEISYFPVR